MIKFRKDLNTKIISLLVAGVFFFNSTVYAIDLPNKTHLRVPLSGNNNQGKERLEQALLYASIGNVVKAENDHDVSLYGESRRALLLSDGNILLREELYKQYLQDKPEAIQLIVHEMVEALLQVIKQKQSDRYQSIKEIALNNLLTLYHNTDRGDKNYRDEILANDIWSVILEHRLMGVRLENVEDKALRNLLELGYKIIDARGNLFGEEFNNVYRVKETVVAWLRKGGSFSKAASRTSHTQGEAKFDEYLVENNLSQYSALRELFTPEIIEVLLDDPALRPVFLQVLPDESLGPIEAIETEIVQNTGGEGVLLNHSAFLVGDAEMANQMVLQGQRIIVGVTDRYSVGNTQRRAKNNNGGAINRADVSV